MSFSLVYIRRLLAVTEQLLPESATNCKTICINYVPGWSGLSNDDITLNRITGGLTNVLTRASISEQLASKLGPDVLSEVLVRHFGQDTETFFDRKLEGIIFEACAVSGVGPKLIAKFEGGRIEGYLNARTLDFNECSKYILPIASKLAEIHHMEIKELPKEPCVFQNLENWLGAASKVSFGEDQPSKRALLAKVDFGRLASEVNNLKQWLLPLNSPVLFCHNDFLAANIMVDDMDKLHAIDFEYGGYNFRSFDIANHFCEWVVDYTKTEYPKFELKPQNYPTESQHREFLSSYLRKYKQLDGEDDPQITEDDINILQKEVDHFFPVPHLMWALWGIVQAGSSTIDFGYLEFTVERIEQYFLLKENLVTKYDLTGN